LVKILANVWDSVNGRLKVDPSGVTSPVSIAATVNVQGAKTNNNAAPGATNVGVLPVKMKIETMAALRKAGFPLANVDEILGRVDAKIAESKIPEVFPNAHPIAGHWYMEPTLEALFVALGKTFQLLEQTDVWGAIGRDGDKKKLAVGDTPQEALAKLWIDLNKK